MQAIKATWPNALWLRRYARLLPILMCSILVWLPGFAAQHEPGVRLLLGICLGMFTTSFYDIVRKVIMRRSYIAHSEEALAKEKLAREDKAKQKL